MQSLFQQGIDEFNARAFFEAHDTWEEVWRASRGPDRLFYQGMIQAAAGLYHLTNSNLSGAGSQLHKAQAKLGGYLPHHQTINTDALAHALAACLRQIAEAGSGRMHVLDGMVIPTILLAEDRTLCSAD